MRGLFAIALACLLAVAGPSSAQMTLTGAGSSKTPAASGYTGPGDVIASASNWYGLRAYNAAYAVPGTNPAADIVDTSTGTATCTIPIGTSGAANLSAVVCPTGSPTVSVTTFCTVTHAGCSVAKLYDQTGNGIHLLQATLANMPTLVFNCVGTFPCVQGVAGNSPFLTASDSNTTLPISWSVVAQSNSPQSNFGIIYGRVLSNGAGLGLQTGNGSPSAFIGSGCGTGSFASGAIALGVANAYQTGFSSAGIVLNINGTDNTATANFCTPQSQTTLFASTDDAVFQTGSFEEGGEWPIAFSPTNRTALCHNQYLYWGLANSC